MEYILKLNSKQRNAVEYVEGPLRVIAGAGSGKTSVLVSKICHLVNDLGISSKRILAITFTNKAANEMKLRINNYLKGFSFPYVMTFHGFCNRFLKEEINCIGWDNDFNIMDEEDQESLIKELMKENFISKEDTPLNACKNYISSSKNTFLTPEQAIVVDKNTRDAKKSVIYNAYAKKQKQLNLLDFDDLLIMTKNILNSNEQVLAKWQQRFDYVMVDEFQDTNDIQYSIVRLLTQKSRNIFVVGDPDQTIYSWRGANINLILDLDNDFPNLKTVILDKNYRSTKKILKASNELISYNASRIAKNLVTDNEDGQKPKYFSALSAQSEANWVANQIADLKKNGVRLKEIVVLYRSNYLSREIEQKLITKSIPYKIYGGFKFFQRKEIKDMIAYLKVVNNWEETSLRRIINVPSRKISSETVDKISSEANRKDISFKDQILDLSDIDLRSSVKQSIQDFVSLIKLIKSQDKTSILQKVKNIYEMTKYEDYLKNEDMNDRSQNIQELFNAIEDFEQRNPEAKIVDFVNEVSLYTSQDEISDLECVSLMTVHLAKGLEFEHVFVIGLSENVFPVLREESEDKLEEERRIAYVAMTRAKKQLYLSSANGFSYVTKQKNLPSRFIEEIGEDNVEESKNKLEVISEGTWNREEKDYSQIYEEKQRDFIVGEHIVHTVFGEGVILKVYGDQIEVAFRMPHGIKTLMSKHKSIIRKVN